MHKPSKPRRVRSREVKQLFELEDDLDAVKDGLVRIRAVADLLSMADPDHNNPPHPETLEGAAGAILREVDDLRVLVGDAINDLAAIIQRPAVPLEVLEGGAT